MTPAELQAFQKGYLAACLNIYFMHNDDVIASDVLAEAGISEAFINSLKLEATDAVALRDIRQAKKPDPIR